MNWKNEAIHKLQRYKHMQQALESLPLELKQLELRSQQLQSTRIGAVGGTMDKRAREEAMLNNLVHREELELALERATLWVQTVDQALALLEPQAREVLEYFYMDETQQPLGEICRAVNLERSSLYRMRDKALAEFTTGIYGFTES